MSGKLSVLGCLGALGLVLGSANAPPAARGAQADDKEDARQKEMSDAVNTGLRWIVQQQARDGRWKLDGTFPDRGMRNDTAATAFGLLPLLAAGHTHKPPKTVKGEKAAKEKVAYASAVRKGLSYLMQAQDQRTGSYDKNAYAHALATLAVCRAYAASKDPTLKATARAGALYIVNAQHAAGGWRYESGQAGDVSVTSWMVQALDAARKAGFKVPEAVFKKAGKFLDSAATPDEGYVYLPGTGGPTPTMTAAGLACRQILQDWDGKNARLVKGIDNYVKGSVPGATKNAYHFYYAAKVMRDSGVEGAKEWNGKLIDTLLATQDKGDRNQALAGSWSAAGDVHGGAGGRMMTTAFALVILEGYKAPPK